MSEISSSRGAAPLPRVARNKPGKTEAQQGAFAERIVKQCEPPPIKPRTTSLRPVPRPRTTSLRPVPRPRTKIAERAVEVKVRAPNDYPPPDTRQAAMTDLLSKKLAAGEKVGLVLVDLGA